jgi:molybdenum cofactor cytidylyltransferase
MSESQSETSCAAIVLAAGASTRLGQPKQLLQMNSESLQHHTIRLAEEAGCAPIFVVLGFEAERMRRETADLDVRVVINPEWQSGMGSSLRSGMEALMKESQLPQRVALLLSDQPMLSSEILFSLVKKSAETDALIVASSYAGRLGVPAVFRKELYPDLQKVEGDKGAREVIQRYRDQTSSIDFPEGAIDIDTVQDLELLKTISPE